MCFSVPMQIIRVDGDEATVEARGVERVVSTLLLYPDRPSVGEYVLVHLGQAIERVSEADAAATWAAIESLFGDEFPETLGTPAGDDDGSDEGVGAVRGDAGAALPDVTGRS